MRKMIDQQTLAGIGSMAELHQHRRRVERCASTYRTQLDRRWRQLTARITPSYILGYVATRTESVLGIVAIVRQIYTIAHSAYARMKRG